MALIWRTASYSVWRGKSVTHAKIIKSSNSDFGNRFRFKMTHKSYQCYLMYSTTLQKNRVGSVSIAGSVQIITDPNMDCDI